MCFVSAKEEKTCCPENDVKVFNDGSCDWFLEYMMSVTHCPMDVTWFPFDEQHCDINFESKTHESTELNVTNHPTADTLVDDYYETNSEWDLSGET